MRLTLFKRAQNVYISNIRYCIGRSASNGSRTRRRMQSERMRPDSPMHEAFHQYVRSQLSLCFFYTRSLRHDILWLVNTSGMILFHYFRSSSSFIFRLLIFLFCSDFYAPPVRHASLEFKSGSMSERNQKLLSHPPTPRPHRNHRFTPLPLKVNN